MPGGPPGRRPAVTRPTPKHAVTRPTPKHSVTRPTPKGSARAAPGGGGKRPPPPLFPQDAEDPEPEDELPEDELPEDEEPPEEGLEEELPEGGLEEELEADPDADPEAEEFEEGADGEEPAEEFDEAGEELGEEEPAPEEAEEEAELEGEEYGYEDSQRGASEAPEEPEEPQEPEEGEQEPEEPEPARARAPLKRSQPDAGAPAKKPRNFLDEVDDDKLHKRLSSQLLRKWGLDRDPAARYVIDIYKSKELENMQRWMPNKADKYSMAEQVNIQLIRNRERAGTPGTQLDAVSVFKYRWQLSTADEKLLRDLGHKDLSHVICEYDGSTSIEQLADEAGQVELDSTNAHHAMPDNPGPFTISRFNRLELIDPVADALVVGDANLTFAIELAKHRQALGHLGRCLVTTFEQIDTLRERYPEIDDTIKDLESMQCEVMHNVDGTRLAVDPRFQGMEAKFGAVYYNFPHAGVVQGFFDGHPFVRWRHENLMHLFFRALRGFVKPGGSVKVSSNSSATGVRFSDILSAAESNEFVHVETIPFLEWQLKDYLRSYGDRRDKGRRPEENENYAAQKAHSDMVYSFCYAPSGEPVSKPRIRYPPSKQDLLNSSECLLGKMQPEPKRRKVEEVYELFLSYVKGIHVG